MLYMHLYIIRNMLYDHEIYIFMSKNMTLYSMALLSLAYTEVPMMEVIKMEQTN